MPMRRSVDRRRPSLSQVSHSAIHLHLHPTRVAPDESNKSRLKRFATFSLRNIYHHFIAMYTVFALELGQQEKQQIVQVEVSAAEEVQHNLSSQSTLAKLQCLLYRIKFHLLVIGFMAVIIVSCVQTKIDSQHLLFSVCSLLWFARFAMILVRHRTLITSMYVKYHRDNSSKPTRHRDFGWLQLHFEEISSRSGSMKTFNESFLSSAYIAAFVFIGISTSILCYLLIEVTYQLHGIELPIIGQAMLYSSHSIVFSLFLWTQYSITICLMVFLLPSFVLSCVIVTNRFTEWQIVLEQSQQLQFSQIRSYIFHARYLLDVMNKQWSSYLTVTILTCVPQILLLLYALVMNERETSSLNQLFGWCWFLVVFAESAVICYSGANIHESFGNLSKSVVDLGSRMVTNDDEQWSSSHWRSVNRPSPVTISDSNNVQTKIVSIPLHAANFDGDELEMMANGKKMSPVSEMQSLEEMQNEQHSTQERSASANITDAPLTESRTVVKTATKEFRSKANEISLTEYRSASDVSTKEMKGSAPPNPLSISPTENESASETELKANVAVNALQISPSENQVDAGGADSKSSSALQLSVNLLLLLVSSINSIDGLRVGGLFTLNFSVIATFLSALFTFLLFCFELTSSE